MLRERITLKNKLGLHTRAAAKLVAVASQFKSRIELQLNNQTADCKSIMAIILLGVTKGVAIDLVITGEDESIARDAVMKLINERFGEAE